MRLLLASVILLAACDTTEITQQQPEVNSGAIALYGPSSTNRVILLPQWCIT